METKEILDIYDINKRKTGKTFIRGEGVLCDDEFVIGVQAIIINSKKEILISKRSSLKEIFPSMWECNGGALLAGEEVVDGIVREIDEELGIKLDSSKAIYLKTTKDNHRFKEIYLFEKDVDIKDLKFIDEEVVDAKWVSIDEFIYMFNKKEIVPNVDFNKEDYEKCLILLSK